MSKKTKEKKKEEGLPIHEWTLRGGERALIGDALLPLNEAFNPDGTLSKLVCNRIKDVFAEPPPMGRGLPGTKWSSRPRGR